MASSLQAEWRDDGGCLLMGVHARVPRGRRARDNPEFFFFSWYDSIKDILKSEICWFLPGLGVET
eukprot:SAG31_NODE_2913_length_4920_cov_2.535988_1_plen_64_part_10